MAAALIIAAPAGAVDFFGHRGASHDAPENTLASEKLAWAQGADGVETDIFLTQDGQLIVSHDPTTRRTTGKDLAIVEHPLEELRRLDAGAWKGPQYAGEKLPTLDEQIALIPPGKRMLVEIKTGPEIVSELTRCLRRTGASEKTITLISFNYDALVAVRKALPAYRTLYLVGYKRSTSAAGAGAKSVDLTAPPRPLTLDEVIAQAKTAKLTGLDLQYTWPLTTAEVQRIKDSGLELHAWTIDDPAVARHWIELGAASVTTNRPGWLREQLKR